MQHYTDTLHDTHGNAISGATIYVYAAGTTTNSTIYSDNGSTTTPNPLTTGSDGGFHFYAANARYDLVITHPRYTFNSVHMRGITLFDGVATGGSGLRSLSGYGVNPSLTVNQTTAIQAAIDADPGPLFFPGGFYLFDQLKISRKNGIVGAGMGPMRVGQFGGTHLTQASGVNVHAIITDEVECPPSYEWFHWCQIENFIMSKQINSTDTIGNGIHISQRIGEGMRIQNVYIERFPGHGIAAMNGSTPLNWSNIHPFSNGGAGIYLYSGGGAGVWDICGLNHISGDGNGWNELANPEDTCLIRVEGGGAARDVVKLMNIKSETRDAQRNAIHLKNTGAAHFDIGPVTHLGLGSDTVDACIRTTGTVNINTFPRIFYHNVRGSGGVGTMVLLRDVANAKTISLATGRQIGTYTGNTTNPPFDPSGLTSIPAHNVASKRTSVNVTVGTLASGDITGANTVILVSTNATPGVQTTRTATLMFVDHFGAVTGTTYNLTIVNEGAGIFTLGAGSGVTLTGTMTVATDTTRTFIVTFTSSTAMTIVSVSSGGV